MGALRRSPTPWGRAARGDHPMASVCPVTTQGGCSVPHSPHPPCSGWCRGSRSPRRGPGKQRRARSASQNPPPPAPAGTAPGSGRGAGTSSTPPATPRPHRTTAVPLSSARLRRRRPISVTLAKSPRARSSRSSACPVAPEAPSTKQDPAPLPPPPVAAMSEGSAVLQAVPCRVVLPAAFPARPCSVLLPAVLPGSRPAEHWLCHVHVMLGMEVSLRLAPALGVSVPPRCEVWAREGCLEGSVTRQASNPSKTVGFGAHCQAQSGKGGARGSRVPRAGDESSPGGLAEDWPQGSQLSGDTAPTRRAFPGTGSSKEPRGAGSRLS